MSHLSPAAPIDYAEIKRIVKAHGLLNPQPAYYIVKTVVALATLGLALGIALAASHPAILLLDAVFLGFASTQVALLGHDVGHRQAFRGRRANTLARFFFGNLLVGISHSWWNTKHNQHHASPNHLDLDPDVQFPMVVFSPEQIEFRRRILRPVIAFQAFVFLFLLPFQAANMRVTSVRHLAGGEARRPLLQALVMASHFALYGLLLVAIGSWPLAIGFALIHQATFGLYNSSVFASNHKGMATFSAENRLDFFREQVLTSRNVSGHPLTDFWYGGLNYQIEHHLFPTMPRNKLREAQVIVERFCNERGVPYHSTNLFAAYREGWLHLHRASASLRRRSAMAH